MTVPTAPAYSAAVNIAVNTAFLGLLDAAATVANLKLRNSADALLATLPLGDPGGTVNGTTGQLALDITSVNASSSGTAAYGELCDGDDNVLAAIPCASGNAAASGFIIMNSLTTVAGEPVQQVYAAIG